MTRIRTYGEKVLKKPCEEVKNITESVLRTVEELKRTLRATERGLGLAAPQIGSSRRIFIAVHPQTKKIFTFINPRLEGLQGKEIDMEGCLSFPEVFFAIERATRVIIHGTSEKGKPVSMEAEGLLARCFQHELDHLNGTLIIDYASGEEKRYWKEKLEALSRLPRS